MTRQARPATIRDGPEAMTAAPRSVDDVHVTTDRLHLRRFRSTDVDALLALDRDPAVRRYVDDGTHPTLTSSRHMIERWLARYEPVRVYGFWAAIDRPTGAFLGWFHLYPADDGSDLDAELGYCLAATAWGRGYATEGSKAIVDRAFASGCVDRIVAETMVVHTASRRVMEKVGMRQVRAFRAPWPVRIPGDEHGDVHYAITRHEWNRQRPG